MKNKKIFLLTLLLPIVALLFLTVFKAYSLQSGMKFILPISGYDPVDPISGHFVTYRIEYGAGVCEIHNRKAREGCICLFQKDADHIYIPGCSVDSLRDCDAFIRGKCRNGRFEAGIEKYFIPEENAETIDKTVRKGKSKIRISVKKDGSALVEDLILVD